MSPLLFSLAALAAEPTALGPLPVAPPERVLSMVVTDEGRLVVAADHDGFLAFDAQLGQWRPLPLQNQRGRALGVASTKDGTVWAIHGCTLSKLGPGGWTHKPQRDAPGGCPLNISPGVDGSVWLGLTRGVAKLVDGRLETRTDAGGVPLSNVTAVAPDRAGNLWVGTGSGLSRIAADGTAEHWTSEQGLLADKVTALAIDFGDRILVGSRKGLSRWDPAAEDWEDIPLLADTAVRSLKVTADATWVGTETGVARLGKGDEGEHVETGGGQPIGEVIAIATRASAVWLGTDRGGLRFHDTADGSWRAWTPTGRWDAVHSRNELAIDEAGRVWVATASGVLRYDPATDGRTLFGAPGRGRLAVDALTLSEGAVWAAAGQHLLRVGDEGLQLLPNDAGVGLRDITGANGKLWAVGRSGLWSYDLATESWTKADVDVPPDASALVADGDALWIGSGEGLARYEGTRQLVIPDSGPEDGVRALAIASDGALLVGTYGEVWRRAVDGSWTSWSEEDGLPMAPVNAVIGDDRALTIGQFTGLARVELASGSAASVDSSGLRNPTVRSLAERGGTLWVGTDSGVQALSDGGWTAIVEGAAVPTDAVRDVRQADGRDALWMVGIAGGAWRYRPTLDAWRRFGVVDGLADEDVLAVWPDADGGVWFGTESGLSYLDPGGQVTTRVPAFRDKRVGAVVRDGSGRLWALADHGQLHHLDEAAGEWRRTTDRREGERLVHDADGVWLAYRPEPDPEQLGAFPELAWELMGPDGPIPADEREPPMHDVTDVEGKRWVALDEGLVHEAGPGKGTLHRPTLGWRPTALLGGPELGVPGLDHAALYTATRILGQPSAGVPLVDAVGSGDRVAVLDAAGVLHRFTDGVAGAERVPVASPAALSLHERLCVGGEAIACTDGASWSTPALDPELSPLERVQALYEDDDALWSGTSEGQLCRLSAKGRTSCLRFDGEVRRIVPGQGRGRVWVATSTALVHVRGKGSKAQELERWPIEALDVAQRDGTVVVATRTGVLELVDGGFERVLEGAATALAAGDDGQLWVLGPAGVQEIR